MVARKAKNCYIWRGFSCIHTKLADLSKKAFSDLYGTPEDFRTPLPSRKSSKKSVPSRAKLESMPPNLELDDSLSLSQSQTMSQSQSQSQKVGSVGSSVETEVEIDSQQPRRASGGSRKEKSLGVLSQRFVQLFLLAGNGAVSLDQAAVQLLGRSPSDPLTVSPVEGDATKLLKTKVRRLYDIANILSSLRLIEKVHTVNRKPAFKWLGPEESSNAMTALQQGATVHAKSSEERSSKRPARAIAEKSKRGTKRRKSFTRFIKTDGEAETKTEQKSPIQANVSPVTDAGLAEVENNEGFDAETMAKVDSVLDTFPESYAKKWREYVSSVNSMLMRGQVRREKAYDCISSLLSQNSGGEDEVTETNGRKCEPQDSAKATGNGSDSQEETASKPLSVVGTGSQVTQASPSTGTSAVKAENARVASDREGQTQNNALTSQEGLDKTPIGDTVRTEDVPARTGPEGPFVVDHWDKDFIDSYMARAKEAGPQHLRAAEDWLSTLRQWREMWQTPFATFNVAPVHGSASTSTNGGHALSAVAVQDKKVS
eukprot:TRINITY_DN955_c0_g1_i2.p1 TRINITY_DN955_c0_g1~~TRINITY_DN955_c0_g1_i2.p1  ORF type:complete len:542 (-),score=79.71 TRINITY_DN955_c0_g1_i2:4674-6299(-)